VNKFQSFNINENIGIIKDVRDLGSVRGKAPHQQAQIGIDLFLTTNIMQQHDKEQDKSNKRAQRPWVAHLRKRSKGHSGAIYRGPLMLSTKYWSRTSR